MKIVLILFFSLFVSISIAQTESDIQKETNPEQSIVIDNSQYAQLWHALINSRESGDMQTYQQIFNQIQEQFSEKFVGAPVKPEDQVLISVDKEPTTSGYLPEGTN